MALIKDARITVVIGLLINVLFFAAKFVAFLYSFVNLFFADAIDSFVDFFVILLVVVFLRFDFRGKLTLITKDFLEFAQWSVIIVFRVVIIMDSIQDLLFPQPRTQPLLVIIVSSITLGGGILLALLFVDEDDVVKFFLVEREKKEGKKKKGCKVLPMFAEALDNLLTSAITLVIGIIMHFNWMSWDKVYIIDDASNLAVSLLMALFACRGIWVLTEKHRAQEKEPLLN